MNRQQPFSLFTGIISIILVVWIVGCSGTPSSNTAPTPTLTAATSDTSDSSQRGQTVPEISCAQAQQLIAQNKIKDLTLVESNTSGSNYPQSIQLILRDTPPSQPDQLDVFSPLLKQQTVCASQLVSVVKNINNKLPQDKQVTITTLEAQ